MYSGIVKLISLILTIQVFYTLTQPYKLLFNCIVGILLFVLAVYFDIKAHSVNINHDTYVEEDSNNKPKIKARKKGFRYKNLKRHTLKRGANL